MPPESTPRYRHGTDEARCSPVRRSSSEEPVQAVRTRPRGHLTARATRRLMIRTIWWTDYSRNISDTRRVGIDKAGRRVLALPGIVAVAAGLIRLFQQQLERDPARLRCPSLSMVGAAIVVVADCRGRAGATARRRAHRSRATRFERRCAMTAPGAGPVHRCARLAQSSIFL